MTKPQADYIQKIELLYPPSQRKVLKRRPAHVPADHIVVSVTVTGAPCWSRTSVAPDGTRYHVWNHSIERVR